MIRRSVFLALPAALTCVLLLPGSSSAQFRGWRGGGMGWGGAWNGGWTSPAYGGTYSGPGYSGYGAAPYYGGGYSPYYYNGGYGGSPYSAYTQPYYVSGAATGVIPAGGYQSNYPSGGMIQGAQDNTRAYIHVRVPPNAQVFFDDTPTQQTGTDRNYVTPPLDDNKYTYEVSARWRDNNGQEHRDSRTVRLTRGQVSNVDFMTAVNTGNTDNNKSQQVPRQPQTNQQQQNNQNLNQNPPQNQNPPTQEQPRKKAPEKSSVR